jgi:L-serine dehydratase
MEHISVFDMFKIGVGPSSSHTLGPWRAAERFVGVVEAEVGSGGERGVIEIKVDLFGSLSKTGKGHGTDVAVLLGLSGVDPVTCDTGEIGGLVARIGQNKELMLGRGAGKKVMFDPATDILFHNITLASHPNALTFRAKLSDGRAIKRTYFSVGGGFVVEEGQEGGGAGQKAMPPFPIETGEDLLGHCRKSGLTMAQVVMSNERTWRSEEEIRGGMLRIWRTMLECMWRGCHSFGQLPGGLNVRRRAGEMNQRLLGIAGGFATDHTGDDLGSWLDAIGASKPDFNNVNKWVSCFALAVNEENACFGRVVTAPTNGAAGVIPAVLMYHYMFGKGTDQTAIDFLLIAGVVGSLFKKRATISAAMGGCQAEIGVSSAMAAAGLLAVTGGAEATAERILMAGEIAMEHHLGMTCDPIGGLVQIPCIERNTMGAIKAITAANIALGSDPAQAKVSFDDVVRTMWLTALDMQSKYKETAEGGLALTVGLTEC